MALAVELPDTMSLLLLAIHMRWLHPGWVTILLLASVSTIAALIRWIVKSIGDSIDARSRERFLEQASIASDLQDRCLQTIEASRMIVDDALEWSFESAQMGKTLHRVSDWLSQAVREGNAAQNLLTQYDADKDLLAATIQDVAFALVQPHTQFSVSVTGRPHTIPFNVREVALMIGCRAILNASSHRHVSSIEVCLTYAHDFTLSVRSNGGLTSDQETMTIADMKKLGERAERIGAKLEVTRSSEAGITVHLILPGFVMFSEKSSIMSRVSKWRRTL